MKSHPVPRRLTDFSDDAVALAPRIGIAYASARDQRRKWRFEAKEGVS